MNMMMFARRRSPQYSPSPPILLCPQKCTTHGEHDTELRKRGRTRRRIQEEQEEVPRSRMKKDEGMAKLYYISRVCVNHGHICLGG